MKNSLTELILSTRTEMSKSHRLIADYVLANYDKVSFMTASKLAQTVGVSESTVVRFATELGFEKFPDFTKSAKELTRRKLTHNQRIRLANEQMQSSDLIEKILLSDAERIRSTAESINREDFFKAAQLICGAKSVFVVGVRSSSALASFLGYYLELFFRDVKVITSQSGPEMLEKLIHLSDSDALVAISYPRYSKSIVDAVDLAKKKDASIVAVTDSTDSPIAKLAHVSLLAQSDMASFADSLAAPLSVLNALVAVIGKLREEDVSHSFELLEQMWDKYDVYDEN
ncbi:MAG: MurR/RpiR family transcriptional regulator [Clostridia bacterium]|nr:MurR/RpiR family transcriptional regulator [Clostridia bacterium]